MWKAAIVIATAVVALTGAFAATPLATVEEPPTGDRAAFRAPPGCPALPEVSETDGESLGELVPAEEVLTATKHLGAHWPLAIVEFETIRDMLSGVAPVQQFDSRLLGTIEVVSDGNMRVDPDEFDALVELILSVAAEHGDERVAALHACYEDRILAGELSDRRLRLFLPADPRLCFRGYKLAPASEGCDARGFTIPQMRVEPSRWNPLRLTMPATVAVAPGEPNGTAPTITLMLVHELVHHLDNEFGLLPDPSDLAAYEQRAVHVEETVAASVPKDELPMPVEYEGTDGREGDTSVSGPSLRDRPGAGHGVLATPDDTERRCASCAAPADEPGSTGAASRIVASRC